jgi:predicted DNA-binding transcriptional regulator YafY
MMRAMDEERSSSKRDRLARMTRILALLNAHPDGMKPAEIARRVDSSVRTVYRDLRSIEGELSMPLWSEGGRWGVDADAFLPPLKLTRSEAMAVVLSARLMVRYADKYDPDLASAFEKLAAVLPAALRAHVDRTLDDLSRRSTDDTFNRHVRLLTQAWAERRVVGLEYAPAPYAPEASPRTARVRPYLIEPSLQTHALYLIGWDETRNGMRTFKIERIRDVSLTPDTFEPPDAEIDGMFERAWDIIADQEPVDVVLRFAAKVASRVREARWHPSETVAEEADGSLTWRATVAGPIEIRLWILSWGDDVEVLEPPALREDVASTHARAAAQYTAASGATPATRSAAGSRA